MGQILDAPSKKSRVGVAQQYVVKKLPAKAREHVMDGGNDAVNGKLG